VKNRLTAGQKYPIFLTMELEEQKTKPDTSQDWMIISMVFWIIFVLIVTIGYLVDPRYTPPIP
jgi:hypothetical protein